MPDSKRRRSGAPSAARVWPQLPTELAEHIISFLDPNEVPGFRLVNQAAAAQFRGPSYTTIRLSQPVPPQLFAAHWLAPGSTRGLTLKRRWQLLSLTAASGVVANLEVALRAAGCTLTAEVFLAAAAAGRLDMCRWLLQRGCPTIKDGASGSQLLAAAALGGQQHVCEWLMGLNLTWMWGGFCEAARGGHVDLMEWLLQRRPQLDLGLECGPRRTIGAAATDAASGAGGAPRGARGARGVVDPYAPFNWGIEGREVHAAYVNAGVTAGRQQHLPAQAGARAIFLMPDDGAADGSSFLPGVLLSGVLWGLRLDVANGQPRLKLVVEVPPPLNVVGSGLPLDGLVPVPSEIRLTVCRPLLPEEAQRGLQPCEVVVVWQVRQ
ncbi:hypothetical protein GPECTOR_545g553 [Gonium pectorale]|uniref:F-box domain-containing protein n=1 Tax=Gonium pectorale TaxID=33097 RepID=A0A150FUM6_GONPE|nr:hypothetical protein GPECTOR_545g553 [Gonium pectorale]|eukprot:KXZ41333.1 hypothetical protein GPECTOR_545g553 [Gonium pectorale]